MELRQSFLAYKKTCITTGWVYRQTPECIQQLAIDLSSYAERLLQTAAPLQYDGLRLVTPHSCWDFSESDSSYLRLWEVPTEIPSIYTITMPAAIMPTEFALKSIIKIGRSVIAVLGLLREDKHKETRRQLKRLRAWVQVIHNLLDTDLACHILFNVELGALEKARQFYEEVDGDDKLMQFLGRISMAESWQGYDEQG